jgi:penicillin-binding protein 2
MFERRLKVILFVLCLVTLVLLLRAAQVQLVDRHYWQSLADKAMIQPQMIETVRGTIVDFKGKPVAQDVASTDVCVDYRAVLRPYDADWLEDQAVSRLRKRMGDTYRKTRSADRKILIEDEVEQVRADVDAMWERLARVSRSPDQSIEMARMHIDEIRQSIVARIEMRRRYLWYRNYEKAVEEHESDQPSNFLERWLVDPAANAPQVDKFFMTIAEQTQSHVVLRAVKPLIVSELDRDAEELPGLSVRPGTHRFYPFHEVAAHVLGRLSRVNAEDMKSDPNGDEDGNELRRYEYNDLIGRTGIEALAEPALRGTRGRIERQAGNNTILSSVASHRGQNVRISIDMDLQRDVQKLFEAVPIKDYQGKSTTTVMYGAAVVIDVPTGQVRVMASYPTYDVNDLDEIYSALARDELNRPLLNRATQFALEPGSTVKPLVGLSAITEGVFGPHEGIECTGFMMLGRSGPLDPNKIKLPNGRCWTASMYGNLKDPVSGKPLYPHHQIPFPHRGHDGNADGFLTFSDGLERSCNVVFQTLADRLGNEKLAEWYLRWGLGRPTGVGISEARGLIPSAFNGPERNRRMANLFCGIGQGLVHATPIQMANVAATIAREGIWKQPTLISPTSDMPFDQPRVPDVDLHLSPEGLAEAKAGMVRVVNAPAGTGTFLVSHSKMLKGHVKIAGKTGTAQAAKFSVVERDPVTHDYLRDKDGRLIREYFEPLNKDNPNGMAWYRGSGSDFDDLAHAWYIGFAPADNPTVAFCVFVEYGGSGGVAAAPIATGVLEACVNHGYLPLDSASSVASGQ